MSTVYIKPELSCLVSHKKIIVADICQVYAAEEKVAKQVRQVPLFQISKSQEKNKISVSSLYVIRHIMDDVPGITVINLGEADFLVEYLPPVPKKKWMDYAKAVVVGIIVFFNHFSRKKITRDPTPMEMEMKKYNQDLIMTKIADSDEKGHTIDVS